jgi:hypothetical protein
VAEVRDDSVSSAVQPMTRAAVSAGECLVDFVNGSNFLLLQIIEIHID